MSIKINKNGKKYPIGVLPQNVIDDVAFLKNASNYSTTEHKVGKWIDGSDLYEKTVSCGALPNASSKTFTHGITNISKIVDIKGYATDGTWSLPLPFAGDSTSAISVYANASQIRFVSGADRTSYTTYITLRYTKV